MFSFFGKKIPVGRSEETIYPRVLMGGAIASVFLAAIGYLGTDIWLASTQWLLIGAILALFAIYLKLD